MRIITNSDGSSSNQFERMKQIFLVQAQPGTEIKIASAFFTSFEILEKMATNQTEIKMIVRLGFGTDPSALKKALSLQNVSIRVFTGNRFHPKFYIFGNRVAYLGSSNLTDSGLMYNQEVNIEIDEDEPVFSELEDTFIEYWNAAHPLEMEDVNKFAAIIKDLPKPEPSQLIKNQIGDFQFNNTGFEKNIKDRLLDFIESFKREYQIFLKEHKKLEKIYINTNLRRYPDVPLRIEIDRFIWWVREVYAKGTAADYAPKRNDSELKIFITPLVEEFFKYKNDFLEQSTKPRYKVLNSIFKTTNSINDAPIAAIIGSLQYVYAFRDHFHRYVGDWEESRMLFVEQNSEEKIKSSFNYLVYGKESYPEKIYRCHKDDDYKLKHFGLNSWTELFGIVNKEEVPILNSRTRKSMKWLGFGEMF